MKLIETRRIDTDKVRALCIRNEYYTHGTNEEYSNMFKMCNSDECDILVIAHDILEHSNRARLIYQTGCTPTEVLENICFELINDCSYTFVEIVD